MAADALPPLEKYMIGESWDDWIESFDDWLLATGQVSASSDIEVVHRWGRLDIFATFTFDEEDDRKKWRQ